jgi:hypothetical protein
MIKKYRQMLNECRYTSLKNRLMNKKLQIKDRVCFTLTTNINKTLKPRDVRQKNNDNLFVIQRSTIN